MMLSSFRMFIRQIASDSMLAVCCAAPALAGVAFRFGLPALDAIVIRYTGRAVVRDYWLLADLLLATLTPFLICFASSMVILEERDEGIGAYLMVTPVGKRGYLASRLLLPALFASLAGLAVLPLFGLSGLSAAEILCLSPAMGVIAVIVSLLVTSISGNRIEGMAVGKLSGLVLCGIVVPFIATGNIRFSFAFLPTFWVAEFFVHRPLYAIPAFIATSALWIAFLYSRFERKTLSSVG